MHKVEPKVQITTKKTRKKSKSVQGRSPFRTKWLFCHSVLAVFGHILIGLRRVCHDDNGSREWFVIMMTSQVANGSQESEWCAHQFSQDVKISTGNTDLFNVNS